MEKKYDEATIEQAMEFTKQVLKMNEFQLNLTKMMMDMASVFEAKHKEA